MVRTPFFLALGLIASCADSSAVTNGSGSFASSAHLAIDATSVYWCDSSRGFVMRAPRGGGEVAEFVAMPSRVHSRIAVNETSVFWLDRRLNDDDAFDFALMQTPLNGGDTSFLAMGGRTGNIAVDQHSAFIVGRDTRGSDAPFFVRRIDLASGDVHDIADGYAVSSVAIDGNDLIGVNCGDGASDGVWRVSQEGGSRAPIGATTGCAYSAVIDEDSVYYKEQRDDVRATLYRVPLAGGAPEELAQTDGYESIAVHRGFAYALIDGAITQVSTDDGSRTPLASASGVLGIAVDEDFVYWVEGPELGPYELRVERLPH